VNFLADESVDRPIVERLRRMGHATRAVAEMTPGIADHFVLRLANADGAMLLTADRDFGELVFRQHQVAEGVILIRLAGLTATRKAEVVAQAVTEHGAIMHGCFTVIEPGRVRIRRPISQEAK
jgi:predicted nuclease of predicted toxin-antitoxin system